MKLTLNSGAKSHGIINPVGAIISKLKVYENYGLTNHLKTIEEAIKKDYKQILSQKEVAGYRDIFINQGYQKMIPAGEKLTELVVKRGLNFYNNIVDSYNIVSAQFAAGIGMHDADKIKGDIVITISKDDKKIMPLFKKDYKTIPVGDLIYHSNDMVMAWLGKRDVDSEFFKVDNSTTSVCIIVLGNKYTSKEYNENIANEIFSLLKMTCKEAEIEFLKVE